MTLKHAIRLITIDLDDTLWPCMPTIMQAEQASYDWLQQRVPKITEHYSMEQLRDRRRDLMQRRPELRNDMSEARRAHFRELADEFDYPYDWVEAGFQVFLTARQRVQLYDDSLPVLQQLASRYTLVALTNGNADIQRTGLGEVFHGQLSAADVQAAKPDPAMFLAAMAQIGVNPEQTLHVGDHPVHDICGARLAGIRSVWVNRLGAVWSVDDYHADYEVSDLNELLQLLL